MEYDPLLQLPMDVAGAGVVNRHKPQNCVEVAGWVVIDEKNIDLKKCNSRLKVAQSSFYVFIYST